MTDIYNRDRDQFINFLDDQSFMWLKAFFLSLDFCSSVKPSFFSLPSCTYPYTPFLRNTIPLQRKIFRWSLTLVRGAELREERSLTGCISICVATVMLGVLFGPAWHYRQPRTHHNLWGWPAAHAVSASLSQGHRESCPVIPPKLQLWGFQSLSPICPSSNLQSAQHLPELQKVYY